VCAECPARLARDPGAAFADLVRHHQDLVYGLALRSGHAPADAEDLAQDAFVRAYRALQSWPPERIAALRPRGWLASIVLNLVRDRARRRAGTQPPTLSLDGHRVDRTGIRGLDLAGDEREGPDAVLAQREGRREWLARLAALPPAQRRAVELRHVEGLSYAEVAVALGRPVGTVKSDVHRGVATLRERWLEERARARANEEVRR
jgi:RNA polymerase sigma factor (sigma-70 family)